MSVPPPVSVPPSAGEPATGAVPVTWGAGPSTGAGVGAGVGRRNPAASASSSLRNAWASGSRRYSRRTPEPLPPATSSRSSARPHQPRHERLDHVHRLQAVQPGLPLRAEQHPAVQVHGLVGHREPHAPPRDRGIPPADQRDEQHDPQRDQPHPDRRAGSRPNARRRRPGSRRSATTATTVFQPLSAGVTGCTRRQASSGTCSSCTDALTAPPAVPHHGTRAGPAVAPPPREAARRSTRSSGRGRVQLHRRDAELAGERPRADVHVLHPPVGHDDERAEQDAAAHQQVVGALGVAQRTHLTRDQQRDPTARAARRHPSAPTATTHPSRPRAPRARVRAGRRRARSWSGVPTRAAATPRSTSRPPARTAGSCSSAR